MWHDLKLKTDSIIHSFIILIYYFIIEHIFAFLIAVDNSSKKLVLKMLIICIFLDCELLQFLCYFNRKVKNPHHFVSRCKSLGYSFLLIARDWGDFSSFCIKYHNLHLTLSN